MSTPEDRRRAPRHSLAVRVELDSGGGETRDISGVGVSFQTDVQLRLDEEIEFTLAIPRAGDVRCRGRVVRITGEAPNFRVAATIEGYAFASDNVDRTHAVVRDIERFHPQGWEWGE